MPASTSRSADIAVLARRMVRVNALVRVIESSPSIIPSDGVFPSQPLADTRTSVLRCLAAKPCTLGVDYIRDGASRHTLDGPGEISSRRCNKKATAVVAARKARNRRGWLGRNVLA